MSEHVISHCPKCGGITVTPPYPASKTAYPYPTQGACKCPEDYKVQSELAALREKNEELERSLSVLTEMHEECAEQARTAESRCTELQRQLDEAAKANQEPVGKFHRKLYIDGIPQSNTVVLTQDVLDGAQLYAKPINLPALIEQARAELQVERDKFELLSKMRPAPYADTDEGLVAQVAELQRKLDEWKRAAIDREELLKKVEHELLNLPALIEQAKAEERESALKVMRKAVIALAHAAESNPTYQAAYEELDAAIRARKP